MVRIIGSSLAAGGGDGGGGTGTGAGGPFTNPAATPGATYPWVGSSNNVNTYTGNKLTMLPIVSWTQKGSLPVTLALIHNSLSSRNGELGPKWRHSFDTTLSVDNGSGNVTVYWGDGRVYTFIKNVDGTYTAPPGVHDSLVPDRPRNNFGNFYYIVTKEQVVHGFGLSYGSSLSSSFSQFRITEINDKNANQMNVLYLAQSNLVQYITDATGRQITLGYSGSRLASVTDPKGRQWGLTYTAAGDLWYVSEPAVPFSYSLRAFAYNAAHDITQTQDRNNNQAYLGYNADNTIAWERDSLGNQTNFSYGTTATTITDPNGHSTIHTYNNSGQLASITDAIGYTEYYSYDGSNNQTQKLDRRGFAWNNTYDGNGNVLTTANPYTNTTTYTYNGHNKPLTIRMQMGRSVVNTYDGNDNLIQMQEKDGSGTVKATTTYAYGVGYGLVTSKTDANNHTTQYGYDANGYLNSVTTPLGHQTQWAYDALGFQTSRTDALSRTTTYTPDAWERRVTTTYPGGSTHTFTYDPNDNLTAFTDGIGTTTRSYDADNRLLTEYQNGVRVITHAYDAPGQKELLSTTTDYLGIVHSFAYTARNQISQAGIPGQTVSYGYDPDSNQTTAVNPNGTQVTQGFDNAGRLTNVANRNSGGGLLFAFGIVSSSFCKSWEHPSLAATV